MASKLEERLRSVDPNYGSQQHQRDFIARMDEVQRRAPCAKDHEHAPSCYPDTVMRAVSDEQTRNRQR
jgi:hypothetical protein